MFVLRLPQYVNTGVFAVEDNNVITNTKKMELQHNAMIKKLYSEDIKFLYAVHHYQGLLDYTETQYFATEKEARSLFNAMIYSEKKQIEEEGLEIYNETETELYFEGKETNHKILLEAIIIPE